MSDIWVLIVLAAVIIFGGYLLSYRSENHRPPKQNKENEHPPKK